MRSLRHGLVIGAALVLLLALWLTVCLSSCAPFSSFRAYAMGTAVTVTVNDSDLFSPMPGILSQLENEISCRLSSSAVSALNAGEERALTSATVEAIRLCISVSEKTNGAFSPFLYPVTSLWDFDAETPAVPDAEALDAAVEKVRATVWEEKDGICRLSGGGIDLGAVGKGMAVDLLAEELRREEAEGLIAVGGSIAAVGTKNGKNWTVGVRDPFSDSLSATVGVLSLKDAFVSTSGSYEKCFVRENVSYHHILDPKTGMPIQNGIRSVTVVAPSGTISDILSTACFAVGIDAGMALCREYGASCLFITESGEMIADGTFAALFTPAGERRVTVR